MREFDELEAEFTKEMVVDGKSFTSIVLQGSLNVQVGKESSFWFAPPLVVKSLVFEGWKRNVSADINERRRRLLEPPAAKERAGENMRVERDSKLTSMRCME